MRSYDDLEGGGVEKRAAPEIDHQEPVAAQVRFGAFHGGFKIAGVGNIELAENVQCDDCIEIFPDKSRALI